MEKANTKKQEQLFQEAPQNAPTLIIKDINDAKILGEIILDDKKQTGFLYSI